MLKIEMRNNFRNQFWSVKQTNVLKIILQNLLLVTKQAEPIKGLLTAIHSFV